MKTLPSHHDACPATPYRRPVAATLRLLALASLNRMRRRFRPHVFTPKSQFSNAHLS